VNASAMSRITAGLAAFGLVAASIVLGATAASAATSFVVSSTADSSTNACSTSLVPDGPSLRDALCAANNHSDAVTIQVAAGTYTLSAGALVVGDTVGANITLTGAAGATIRGNGSTQLMSIDPDLVGGVTVALSGFTFSGGADTVFGGGAIIGGSANASAGDALVISDSVFTGNSANAGQTTMNNPGGALQFIGGRLTLSNVDFVDNSSGTSPGGALSYQATGASSGELLSITGGSFRGNSAVAGDAALANGGGAVVVDAPAGVSMTVTGTTFSDNSLRVAAADNARAGSTVWVRSGSLTLSRALIRTSATDRSLSGAALTTGNSGVRIEPGASLDASNGLFYDDVSGRTVVSAPAGATTTLANNFWGCNTGLAVAGSCAVTDSAAAAASASPRLLFSATASPTTLDRGVTSSTLSTVVSSSSGSLPAAAAQTFTDVPVTWTAVTPAAATIPSPTVGAIGTATYQRNGSTGAGGASVTLGYETASVQLVLADDVAFTSADSAAFPLSAASNFQVVATGYPAAEFTTAGPLPAGITLSRSGSLSGVPTAAGVFPFSIRADNGTTFATQAFTLTVTQPVTFTSANSVTGRVGTGVNFTVTTASTPTASVSYSGALPTGVTVTPGANGTATIAGTPAAGSGGSYPLTLTATATGQDPATQAFTLVVNQPPTVSTQPQNVTVNAGNPVSFTAAASGFPAPTVQWQVDSGSGFAAIAGATSTTYTFTAAQGDNGNAYRAVFTNGTGTAQSAAATLTVGTAPTFSSTSSASFAADGSAQTFAITTSGVPNASITSTGTLPAWILLTDDADGTATLSGTPPTGSGGIYSFGLVATNGFGSTATQPFTLTVNEAPRIAATNSGDFRVGTAGSLAVTATNGFPAATTLASAGALPSGVSFVDNGGGSGTFAGTPAAATGGTYTVTVTASNSAGSATQTVTITVNQTVAVVAQPTDRNVEAGASVSFAAAASGFPSPAVQWQVSTDAGATFTSVAGANSSTLTFVAAQSDNGNRYRAVFSNDTTATSLAATLTVGTAPAITSPATATFTAGGGAQDFVITATGAPQPTLTMAAGAPSWLALSGSTLTATPPATAGGSYSVSLTASNGYGTDATQTLAISVAQTPAVTSAAAASFAVGTAGSFSVTTTGNPTPGIITVSGALPSGVAFASNGDGTATISGVPAVGTGGAYRITINASNGTVSASQSFVLTVTEAVSITSAASARFVDGVVSSFAVTTAGGFPTAAALTLVGTLPSGLAFVDNGDGTATLAGRPTSGAASVTVTVAADNGTTTSQQLGIVVDVAPTVTTQPRSADVATGTVVVFSAAASGSPAPTVQWQSSADGVTFADIAGATTGTLTVTATQSGSGTRYRAVFFNGSTTTSAVATLTVGTPPVITSTDRFGVTDGAGVQRFSVTTTAVPAATLTLSGAPAWLTLADSGDGTAVLTAAPPVGTAGDFTATISANNSYGAAAVQTITVTVSQRAVFTSGDSASFTAGRPGAFRVTTGGTPAPSAITVTGDLPQGVTVVDNRDGTATLSGSPVAGSGGAYRFTLSTTNGVGPAAVQAFTLTVNEAVSSVTDATVEVTTGVRGSTKIATAGGYPAATSLTLAGDLPEGLTFTDNGDGTATIAGVPAAGATSASVSITATNAAGVGAPIAVRVTVSPAAAIGLPADVPFTLVTLEGVPASVAQGQVITVSGGGFAAGAPVTVGIYSTPTALASVTADGAGRFAATITIPRDYLGAHSIVASGVAAEGAPRFARADTTVVAISASSTPVLAATGPWDGLWIAASLALLLVLGGLRLMTRRRRAA
jgi:hypothetical protein